MTGYEEPDIKLEMLPEDPDEPGLYNDIGTMLYARKALGLLKISVEGSYGTKE